VNVLFVCTYNQCRSRTAETIFGGTRAHQVRSVGTDEEAWVQVAARHVEWADMIFVMEERHSIYLRKTFPTPTAAKRVICLQIPDEYEYMDDVLIRRLRSSVAPYVDFAP
jgi:predicted protein tyrosine phosphatase